MNSNNQPPRNPNALPQLNDLADTRAFLDSIRNNLSYSWNGIEHVIKFLTEALQEKTNDINTLRKNITAYENLLNEKNTRIMHMEQMLTRMQAQIQEKDYLTQQKESSIQERESLIGRLILWNEQTQAKVASYEESMQVLSSKNEDLKAKLSQAEEQSRAVLQGFKLTEEQEKVLSGAISRELAQRANLINAKAKEAQNVSKYQRRVTELEEQLRLLRAKTSGEHDIGLSKPLDQIEGRQYGESNPPHPGFPKNAMINSPSLPDPNNGDPHQQSVPAHAVTAERSSSSNNHDVVLSSTQPTRP
ncbi:hypothetical protein Clacol_002900 [Clathrus columnatus]|uniref:Uncharacterized protein n=1 Tax=Clathrus columnatus TaxID=1419009 RepID=A0AAV5A6Q1_9AGAM|nr:hypothetical protein Clacol_002900 [Clathrus columnatus]